MKITRPTKPLISIKEEVKNLNFWKVTFAKCKQPKNHKKKLQKNLHLTGLYQTGLISNSWHWSSGSDGLFYERVFIIIVNHDHTSINNCSTLVNVGTRRGTIDKTEVGFDRGVPKSVFRIGRFRAENVEIEIVTSDINKPYVIITITNRKLTTNTPFLYNQQY